MGEKQRRVRKEENKESRNTTGASRNKKTVEKTTETSENKEATNKTTQKETTEKKQFSKEV